MPSNLQLLPKFKEKLSYLYIEHAVIEKESQSIVIFNKTDAETSVTQVPVCDLALLMLGPGTKISHAAIDVIRRNNCLILWTGEEGVRLYAFGTGGTHSSERLLKQAKLACDPKLRLEVSRKLYGLRFPDALDPAVTIEQLRGKEGYRVRNLYQTNATKYGIAWEGRSYDRNQWQGSEKLWEKVQSDVKSGSAVMVFTSRTEQGFSIFVHGDPSRFPIDYEGITLIQRRLDS